MENLITDPVETVDAFGIGQTTFFLGVSVSAVGGSGGLVDPGVVTGALGDPQFPWCFRR